MVFGAPRSGQAVRVCGLEGQSPSPPRQVLPFAVPLNIPQEFAPRWCNKRKADEEESGRNLRYHQWGPAFDRYIAYLCAYTSLPHFSFRHRAAIALACSGQWDFVSALAHKDNVLQVSVITYLPIPFPSFVVPVFRSAQKRPLASPGLACCMTN